MILKLQNAGKFITTSGSGYIPPSRNIIPSKKSPTAATINQWLKGTFSYITGIKDSDLIESKYRPSKETNTTTKYYTRKGLDYDVMRNLLGGKESSAKTFEGEPLYYKNFNDLYNRLSNKTYRKGRLLRTTDNSHLGEYTIGIGEDNNGRYVSYYDKFDWAPNEKLEIFSPYEIYNRIYEKDFNRMLKELNNETYSGSNPSGNWFFKSGMNNKGYFKFGGKTANARKWKYLNGGTFKRSNLSEGLQFAATFPFLYALGKAVDPTGISGYSDVRKADKEWENNPSLSNGYNVAVETFGALPIVNMGSRLWKTLLGFVTGNGFIKDYKEASNLSDLYDNELVIDYFDNTVKPRKEFEKHRSDVAYTDANHLPSPELAPKGSKVGLVIANYDYKYKDHYNYKKYVKHLDGGIIKALEGTKTNWWSKIGEGINKGVNSKAGLYIAQGLLLGLGSIFGGNSSSDISNVAKNYNIQQLNAYDELELSKLYSLMRSSVDPENSNANKGVPMQILPGKIKDIEARILKRQIQLEKEEMESLLNTLKSNLYLDMFSTALGMISNNSSSNKDTSTNNSTSTNNNVTSNTSNSYFNNYVNAKYKKFGTFNSDGSMNMLGGTFTIKDGYKPNQPQLFNYQPLKLNI